MIVQFKEWNESADTEYRLDAKLEDSSILITTTYSKIGNENKELSYRFEKNELSDFIGALLHLQSKLKRR
jgi:hypothetical protein